MYWRRHERMHKNLQQAFELNEKEDFMPSFSF